MSSTLKRPFESRRMAVWLCRKGYDVNRKRAQRLMRIMGIEGVGSKPGTSKFSPDHEVYPYLLRHVEILRPNQVWSTDITYCRMLKSFMYLVAVIDWYSRCVLSWQVSNTLDASFCIEALMKALERGQPEVFDTDQGGQFTNKAKRLHSSLGYQTPEEVYFENQSSMTIVRP